MTSPRRVVPHACVLVLALSLSLNDSSARSANGDTTGASLLGSPPDVVSVDPTQGAAGMTYGFEVPPGRIGLQPQFALRYNSGSSEPGAYGRGWSLALPLIRRSTRLGQPRFDWNDTFALQWNGGANDLMKIADYTVGNVGMREFRTLIETFMRIRSFTEPGGFTHWEVWDGAGRRYEFGNPGTDGSPTQQGDFQWTLNRVEDSHGNYMTIDWLLDEGTLYPLVVRYTGKVGGLAPSNRVEFAYEGRYDIIGQRLGVKAAAGSRKVRYRLRRVKTFAGNVVASVYLLEYSTPGTGELTSDLCAGVTCGQSSWFCPGDGLTATCQHTCDQQTGFCESCTPSCCGQGCATITTTCSNGSFAACVQQCDQFYGTRMLQAHSHMSEVRNHVADAVTYGGLPSDRRDYELSGLQGIPKYARDYSTLATGGATGNLAVTYLGGYALDYQVRTIDQMSGTAVVQFHAWNSSTVESLLHVPVVGYTDWWRTHIGSPINSYFTTGPLSPTTQDFRWSETIVWR